MLASARTERNFASGMMVWKVLIVVVLVGVMTIPSVTSETSSLMTNGKNNSEPVSKEIGSNAQERSSPGINAVTSWSTSANSLPTAVEGAGLVSYNGYIIQTGGYAGASAFPDVRKAQVQPNGNIGSWSSTTSLPAGRTYHGSVAYNGYIYVIGGGSGGSPDATTVYYTTIDASGNVGTWNTATNALPQTWGLGELAVCNGYLYAIGGAWSGTASSAVYYSQIGAGGEPGVWTSTTSMPGVRSRLSYDNLVYSNKIYVPGGYDGSVDTSTTYYATCGSGAITLWSTATNGLPEIRSRHGAAMDMNLGQIYVLGGYTGAITATTKYATINPSTGNIDAAWTNGPDLPGARRYPAAVYTSSQTTIHVAGGQDGSAVYQTTVYYGKTQTNSPPAISVLLTPWDFQKGGEWSNALKPEFNFSTTDPESNNISYNIQVDDDIGFGSPIINANSSTDPGFSDITNPADTDPFASGDVIKYTAQMNLVSGTTYWWRVQAKDPAGSNVYSPFSESKSFTVENGMTKQRWYQTTKEQFDKDIFSGGATTTTYGGGDVEAPDPRSVYDTFSDNDYTIKPTWTVGGGQVFFDDVESGAGSWSAIEQCDQNNANSPFASIATGPGYYQSPIHAWWVDDPGGTSNQRSVETLMSPAISIPNGANSPQFKFYHRMTSEASNWDHGWLQYRIGAGSWNNVVATDFVQGGYNAAIPSGSYCTPSDSSVIPPASGTNRIWATAIALSQVILNIPTGAIGKSIQFRFAYRSDDNSAPPEPNGWWLDDIEVTTSPAGLWSASNGYLESTTSIESRISTPISFSSTDSYCWEMRYKHEANDASDSIFRFYPMATTQDPTLAPGTNGYYLTANTANGSYNLVRQDGSSVTNLITTTITDDTSWHLAKICRSSSAVWSIYRDGGQLGSPLTVMDSTYVSAGYMGFRDMALDSNHNTYHDDINMNNTNVVSITSPTISYMDGPSTKLAWGNITWNRDVSYGSATVTLQKNITSWVWTGIQSSNSLIDISSLGTTPQIRLVSNLTFSMNSPKLLDWEASWSAPSVTPPSVTLTSPNGGESWLEDSSQTITWNPATPGDYPLKANPITLYYSSTGPSGPWTQVATNLPNTGSYSPWLVPLVSTTNAYARVMAEDNQVPSNIGYDISNSAFTIYVVPPSVTLTSPNGGENWSEGSTQTITWNPATPGTFGLKTNPISLYYSTTGPSGPWTQIASNLPNTGSYSSWVVPSVSTTNAYVRIMAEDNQVPSNPGYDNSNSSFTIHEVPPSVTLTHPNGGENWMQGSSQMIMWNPATAGTWPLKANPITLYYSTTGQSGPWTQIATDLPNTGLYSPWIVPTIITTNAYIKIEAADNRSPPNIGNDTSNSAFSISLSNAPVVSVIAPNGGEKWFIQAADNITWNATAGIYPLAPNPITILFSTSGSAGPWTQIVTNLPNSGSYNWSISASIPPSVNTFIKVQAKDNQPTPNVGNDTSDFAFTLAKGNPPIVTVTSPNGGETWPISTKQNITWTVKQGTFPFSVNPITICYSTSGSSGPWTQIVTNLANTGTYQWTVQGSASANAYLKVEAKDDRPTPNIGNDTGDAAFTISQPPDTYPPYIVSTNPIDGATNVSNTTKIDMKWNESMNQSSAQSAFSSTPVITCTWSWIGVNQTCTPTSALQLNTKYSITISTIAKDLVGNSMKNSHVFSFTILPFPDTYPPYVVSTLPTGGATNVSNATKIDIKWNESMNETSTESAFSSVPTIVCAWSWSGTNQTCTPGVPLNPNTRYVITIATTAKDLAGNAMKKTFMLNFTTANIIIPTPPTITSTSPTNGSTNIPINANIAITFSETMNKTATEGSISANPSITGAFAWDGMSKTVTWTPSTNLQSNTKYTVTIATSAKSQAGVDMKNAHVFSFTTSQVTDSYPPYVVATTPINAATNVSTSAVIVIQWNESMDQTSAESAFSSNPSIACAWTWGGSTQTCSPTANLQPVTKYSIMVASTAKDIAGNAMKNTYSFAFTTRAILDVTPPTVKGTVPTNGSKDVDRASKITIIFSEKMDQIATESAVAIAPGFITKQEWNANNTILSLTATLETETKYVVTISTGAKDLAGNAMLSKYTFTFTTKERGGAGSTSGTDMFFILMILMIVIIVCSIIIFVLLRRRKEDEEDREESLAETKKVSEKLKTPSTSKPEPKTIIAPSTEPTTGEKPKQLGEKERSKDSAKKTSPTDTIVCPLCGNKVPAEMKWCLNCGEKIVAKK